MINKLILILLLCLSSIAADLHLFNSDGSFYEDFSDQILSGDLKANEKIFLKNKEVTFKGILGSGNTTIILRVVDSNNEELALRLPYGNPEKNFRKYDGQRFINYTYEGYKDLLEANLPIPKIYSYYKNSYLLVDLVDHDFDLRSFLARNDSYSSDVKEKASKALINFARETAIFESIGDFHLQQVVYSSLKNKWFLLDWTDNHQLARLPSSPKLLSSFLFADNNIAIDEEGEEITKTIEGGQVVKVGRDITEFENDLLSKVNKAIEEQRIIQKEIDDVKLLEIKAKLSDLTDHEDILKIYSEIKTTHMASFFTMLQKDFISNQLAKFPMGSIRANELKVLMDNLGKFTPYFFSQFSEKMIANVYDLETFMFLFHKLRELDIDEDFEEEIADAIALHIKNIISNTPSTPEAKKMVEELKSDYRIMNYRAKQILEQADELMPSQENCSDLVMDIMGRTN